MTSKRIYILNGHPARESLSGSFAETYARAARDAGHEVRIAHLHDLEFDIDFGVNSYKKAKQLEPDLEHFIDNIKWCEHMVLTTPMWWGGLPAKLKGAIDRAFMPGITFDNRVEGKLPQPMLSGRSARVIMTSDTPGWFMRLIYKNAIIHQLRKQILGFVGLTPSRFTHFSAASHPTGRNISDWFGTVRKLGLAAQ